MAAGPGPDVQDFTRAEAQSLSFNPVHGAEGSEHGDPGHLPHIQGIRLNRDTGVSLSIEIVDHHRPQGVFI